MAVVTLESSSRENFSVRLFRDGSLEFESDAALEAYEYDRSMMEFGEDHSALTLFVQSWTRHPLDALISFVFDETQMVLLALDALEHVVPLFRRSGIQDKTAIIASGNKVYDLIDVIRGSITGGGASSDGVRLHLFRMKMQALKEYIPTDYPTAKYITDAALAIIDACEHFGERFYVRTAVMESILDSARAYAYVGSIIGSEVWQESLLKEKKWQIRRAIDALDEVQAGRPWPRHLTTESNTPT